MVNAGTWNSDLALLFLLTFFAPLVLFFLLGCIIRVVQIFEKTYTVNVYQAVKPYSSVKKTIIEHRTIGKPKEPNKPPKSKPSISKSNTPKPCNKKKPINDNWNDDIVADAVIGLKGLGYKMSEARRIASKIYAKNTKMKSDDIIIAAMEKRF